MMREVIKNVKVAEIPNLIAQLGLSPEQQVNLTIEDSVPDNELLLLMDRIGRKAQEKGLTEEQLADLLQDES
jgi:hypothetical protein